MSSLWQRQISVHGKLLVPDTHLLAQMLQPLQEQMSSLSTSALTEPSKKKKKKKKKKKTQLKWYRFLPSIHDQLERECVAQTDGHVSTF